MKFSLKFTFPQAHLCLFVSAVFPMIFIAFTQPLNISLCCANCIGIASDLKHLLQKLSMANYGSCPNKFIHLFLISVRTFPPFICMHYISIHLFLFLFSFHFSVHFPPCTINTRILFPTLLCNLSGCYLHFALKPDRKNTAFYFCVDAKRNFLLLLFLFSEKNILL